MNNNASNQPKIGFIGLGLMGYAMVSRLQDKGYSLTVLGNRARANIEAAVKRGAREAESAKDLAMTSDIVMICVDRSENVEARMRQEDGVFSGVKKGSVIIDFGTSLPESTIALGQQALEHGAFYLDAPLGRTPTHAERGELNIMAAGDKEAYEKVLPILNDLGENVFHLGKLGSGHTIKLFNNFLGMATANAVAEIYAMADRAGIDRQLVYNVVSAGPLHSGMMDFVSEYALKDDKSALAFTINNAAKDVYYYLQMTKSLDANSKLANTVSSSMNNALDSGYGPKHVCELMDYYIEQKD